MFAAETGVQNIFVVTLTSFPREKVSWRCKGKFLNLYLILLEFLR